VSCATTGAQDVTNGYQHTCARLTDGAVRCWGYNGQGQLGNGTTSNNPNPVTVSGLANATQLTAGYYHSCARLSTSAVQCWGYNGYGQLGDNTTSNRSTPVTVSGLSATQVSAGIYHTCARLADGTARCWGYNAYGQIGDGTGSNRYAPVAVSGLTGVTQVGVGGYHSCAVRTNGTVWCWGYNGYGQLGNGTTADRTTPVAVSGISTAVGVWAGFNHTCARLADGTARCWGYNGNGQLGDGTGTNRYTPVAVSGLSAVAQLTLGDNHTCARLTDGTARCWGYNGNGALGDGTATSRTTPVAVSGLTNATDITAFYRTTCATRSDLTVHCWGDNGNGQVGDNTYLDRRTFTQTLYVVPTDTLCGATPATPGAETCNGVDDDCNGVVDDGVTRSCYTGPSGTAGVGACRAGTETCVVGGGGTWGACAGQVLPSAETCNNVDDDCDGIVDDGFCRIAGTCYNPNQVNPASTCQYCAAAANAAPPNVWSNYANGTACGSPTGGLCTSGVCGCPGGQTNCSGFCRVTGASVLRRRRRLPPHRRHRLLGHGHGVQRGRRARPHAESCNGVDDDCNGTIDNGPSTACASAIDLGTLNVGSIATRIEWIPAPAGSEQWYYIRIPQSADVNQHGTGTPQIRVTGSASVRFEVRSSCSAVDRLRLGRLGDGPHLVVLRRHGVDARRGHVQHAQHGVALGDLRPRLPRERADHLRHADPLHHAPRGLGVPRLLHRRRDPLPDGRVHQLEQLPREHQPVAGVHVRHPARVDQPHGPHLHRRRGQHHLPGAPHRAQLGGRLRLLRRSHLDGRPVLLGSGRGQRRRALLQLRLVVGRPALPPGPQLRRRRRRQLRRAQPGHHRQLPVAAPAALRLRPSLPPRSLPSKLP
jgi:alpha-tubulin suppressor-like RCC1 family protein